MAVTLDVETVKAQVMVSEAAKDVQGLYSRQSFDDAFWAAKLETAKALVERYAPAAPEAVANEAALRVIGYLFDRSAGLVERSSDGLTVASAPGQISALRHSGAMALLSPWKVRRGGVV